MALVSFQNEQFQEWICPTVGGWNTTFIDASDFARCLIHIVRARDWVWLPLEEHVHTSDLRVYWESKSPEIVVRVGRTCDVLRALRVAIRKPQYAAPGTPIEVYVMASGERLVDFCIERADDELLEASFLESLPMAAATFQLIEIRVRGLAFCETLRLRWLGGFGQFSQRRSMQLYGGFVNLVAEREGRAGKPPLWFEQERTLAMRGLPAEAKRCVFRPRDRDKLFWSGGMLKAPLSRIKRSDEDARSEICRLGPDAYFKIRPGGDCVRVVGPFSPVQHRRAEERNLAPLRRRRIIPRLPLSDSVNALTSSSSSDSRLLKREDKPETSQNSRSALWIYDEEIERQIVALEARHLSFLQALVEEQNAEPGSELIT
jgi:hypothetical protein